MSKITSLGITALFYIILIFSNNPLCSMDPPDQEENIFFSAKKLKSDSTSDSDDTESEHIFELLKEEAWGATAAKLLREFRGHNFDVIGYATELEILLKVAKSGPVNSAILPTLTTILSLFESQEAQEATDKLRYAIALDHSIPFKVKKSALDDLEHSDFPESKKLAYEAYKTLAMDKSLSFLHRYKAAKFFLHQYNMKDLKYFFQLAKKILEESNYNEEISFALENEIDSNTFVLIEDLNLNPYAQKQIGKLLGCCRSFPIWQRFLFIQKVLTNGKEPQPNLILGASSEKMTLKILNSIKHRIKEGEFKALLRQKLSEVPENQLKEYFYIIESFYQTADTELPPLYGNLNSYLGIIDINFEEEYQQLQEQEKAKMEAEFFDSIKASKSAARIWNSIITDAKKDPNIMQKLQEYIQHFSLPIQKKIMDLLS